MAGSDSIRPGQDVLVDLVRDEVVTRFANITITAPSFVGHRPVARAISVRGIDGKTHQMDAAGGRFIWKPREPLPPGRQSLVIRGLTLDNTRLLTRRKEIPFFVVDTNAVFPESVRVQSFVRIRLLDDGFERLATDHRPDGQYIDVLKAVERGTGASVSLAFDALGNPVAGDALIAAHREGLERAGGKLHPSLRRHLVDAAPDRSVLVDVWFDASDIVATLPRRPFDSDAEALSGARQRYEVLRRELHQRAQDIAARLKAEDASIDVVNLDQAAPVITLRVQARSVVPLAQRGELVGTYLHEQSAIEDLTTSIAVARSNLVHAGGQAGAGVSVAVWETAPTSTTNLDIIRPFRAHPPETSGHSQNVHAIIQNKAPGVRVGHAPECRLFSANDIDRTALTWAMEQGCSVVNQSFHRPEEAKARFPSTDDRYADWLASAGPCPLIVQAAGNFGDGDDDDVDPPRDEYVNHKGYNTISVGNHDDTATDIDPSSTFRNPGTPHGDRELPDIAANGTEVTADSLCYTGTSQAAPVVAGVAALIQGTAPLLRVWPEGCRAILFASARRMRVTTWWQDVQADFDSAEGAGAVDAAQAEAIALARCQPGLPPASCGWDVGYLEDGNFDGSSDAVFSYQIQVPTSSAACKVKVALAWSSSVAPFSASEYASILDVDLDLNVYDASGTVVGHSGSFENSYEIADYVGEPGGVYTIKIRRKSGTAATTYGIAWLASG